jgi:hypothetical protein
MRAMSRTVSTRLTAAGPAVADPMPATTGWREAFVMAWRVFLPARLALSLAGALAMLATQGRPAERSPGAWLDWLLVRPWLVYDVDWYLKIAREGYGIADGRAAFHPLLPLLMRAVGDLLGGQYGAAGLLAANSFCLLFLAALYRYVALDHGAQLAGEGMRWALYVPVGFVLLIPYTESLLLAFSVLALWYARHDRWLAAGLCACLAALTKQPGAALALPLLWEYGRGHSGRLWRWRTLWALACMGLGPLGYLGFSAYRVLLLGELDTSGPAALIGSLVVSRQLGDSWETSFGMPWQWAANVIAFIPRGDWYYWLHLALAIGGLAAAAAALRRERGAVVIYSLTQILLATTLIIVTVNPLLSLPRRLMLVFPISTQLARWGLRSRLRAAWLLLSALSMLVLAGFFCATGYIP